jgi:hypothetical protein
MILMMRAMIFFFNIVLGGAMLAQVYFVPFLDKNPKRTSNTSGMG